MPVQESSYLGQSGVWITNSSTRLFVQHFGGMTPEFSTRLRDKDGAVWLNTHWQPHFKASQSGFMDSTDPEQSSYWGIELLRQAAGTFPCAPTFGPGNDQLLPHGDCANTNWQLNRCYEVDVEYQHSHHKANIAHWQLQGQYRQLQYQKWDYLYADQSAHYCVLQVHNPNDQAVDINLAWHTTLGAPFLERGCLVFNNCNHFKVAPAGTEFDQTTQLEPNLEFTDFSAAPTKSARQKNLHLMDGYTGHSDFVSGTTDNPELLWSLCVNPYLNLAYLSVIPLSRLPNQVNAQSMNYWNHCGGRDFTPWADYQGGVDRTYALGMEAAIGSSCQGLEHSRSQRTYMDKPSCYALKAQQTVTFPCINSLFELTSDELALATDSTQHPTTLNTIIEAAVMRHIATLDLSFTAVAVANNN